MQLIRSIACNAVLLGTRDYLHSTTILRSLLENVAMIDVGDLQQVVAQFHDLTSRQCVFDLLVLEGNESLTRMGYVATFRVRGEAGEAVLGLRPLDSMIREHRPFDEDSLALHSEMDIVHRCIQGGASHGALLETVVALNKRLHAALFDSHGYAKWLLTRVELNHDYFIGKSPTRLRLVLLSELASINTKVAIEADDRVIGLVQFSRKKEAA
jgi:hypothetical protein